MLRIAVLRAVAMALLVGLVLSSTPARPQADPLDADNDYGRTLVGGTSIEGEPRPADSVRPVDVEANFQHLIDRLRANYRLNGSGVAIGIWDGGPVLASHQEFRAGQTGSRVVSGEPARGERRIYANAHATHVAGLIGAFGLNDRAEGVAPQAALYSFDFCGQVWTEVESAYGRTRAMTISSHSWQNSALLGRYAEDARNFDDLIARTPEMSVIVAAGNQGTRSAPFRTVTDPGTAKNAITVGAMVSIRGSEPTTVLTPAGRQRIRAEVFSGRGPTIDGRIKPDIVASGFNLYSPSVVRGATCSRWRNAQPPSDPCSNVNPGNTGLCYAEMKGTSMATPVVSGALALLQELAQRSRAPLRADEMRGLLIHTAVSRTGRPTYGEGWGALQALRAGDFVTAWSATPKTNNLGRGFMRITLGDAPVRIRVARRPDRTNGFEDIRVTIVWIDEPGGTAEPLEGQLVSDIDLSLSYGEGGSSRWLPWTLDQHNPTVEAVRAVNNRDNVERIDVASSDVAALTGDLRLEIVRRRGSANTVVVLTSGLNILDPWSG